MQRQSNAKVLLERVKKQKCNFMAKIGLPLGGGSWFLQTWPSTAPQMAASLPKQEACHTEQLYLGLPWQTPFPPNQV